MYMLQWLEYVRSPGFSFSLRPEFHWVNLVQSQSLQAHCLYFGLLLNIYLGGQTRPYWYHRKSLHVMISSHSPVTFSCSTSSSFWHISTQCPCLCPQHLNASPQHLPPEGDTSICLMIELVLTSTNSAGHKGVTHHAMCNLSDFTFLSLLLLTFLAIINCNQYQNLLSKATAFFLTQCQQLLYMKQCQPKYASVQAEANVKEFIIVVHIF